MSIAAAVKQRAAETFTDALSDNPVLVMGFRTRMRKATGFMVMGAYVLFLAVVLLITWYVSWNWGYTRGAASQNANVGRILFAALTITQSLLFLFIVPALTSGGLTQELERRTMELLALTPLTPGKIVLGKHMSAFVYCLALLICSIPLAGMCLMLGGLSPAEIAMTTCLLAAWCFMLASTGVFWSSLFRSTAAAVLFTYGSTGVYMIVTALVTGNSLYNPYGGSGNFILTGLNPCWASTISGMTARVCSLSVSLGLVAFLLHTAIGLLLLFTAMTHVLYHRTQKALPVRILLLVISLGLVWLIIGNGLASGNTLQLKDWLEGFASVMLPLLCLLAPIFTTGVLTKSKESSVWRYALSPRKMFQSDLGGGLYFMLLWAASAYVVCGLTMRWAQATMPSTIPAHMYGVGPVSVGFSTAPFWSAYFTTGIAILAIITGVSAVGLLFSCIMQSRRNAAGVSILFLLIVFGGYLIPLIYYTWGPFYNSGVHGSNSIIYQVAAFWPMTPILSIASWQGNGLPTLWWSREWSWLISSIIYLLLAVGALALAGPAARRFGGVKED